MIYQPNFKSQLFEKYFKYVTDMNDFTNTIKQIPFDTLCILAEEVKGVDDKGCIGENTIIYQIIKEHGFDKFITFPVNLYNMCSQIEHTFLIRYVSEKLN